MTPMKTPSSSPREGGPTFPLRHRLLRLAWAVTWTLLGRWTPVPLHGWRRFLLRGFGARLHPTAKIYPSVRVWYPPNLTMGEHACLGPEVNCYCMDRIDLRAHALVSQGSYLCAGTHDVDDPDFPLVTRPILIERNAWVAAQAFVGPGVRIGEGAVLGARGVTVKSLEPFTIYAGNPAKPLRRRRLDGGAA